MVENKISGPRMSSIISPQSFFPRIKGSISEKKQVYQNFIDLTVSKIFRLKSEGNLDFGGGEYSPSATDPCSPVKNSIDDSYGWWNLHEGYFLLGYNESFSLQDNEVAVIQPHPHLLHAGCFHSTLLQKKLDEDFRVLLWVQKLGVNLKENARISQLMIISL